MTPDIVLAVLAFVGVLYALWHLPMSAKHVADLVQWFERKRR